MFGRMVRINAVFLISIITSCVHVTTTSSFGRLSKGHSEAKRDLVEDLIISKSLAENLKKSGVDSSKFCAQKVAYFSDSSSEVFFEFHAKPCNGRILNSPILVAKWNFVSDKNKRFHMSQFTIDERVVGASAANSDEIAELCSAASAKNCQFKREENKEGKESNVGKKGKIVAVLTEE
ncbi:MAG: hypothetical protein KBD78_06295 [Oligoflexales bacterium]|nr:hypothetical protein [Oligoflexales bacterium]